MSTVGSPRRTHFIQHRDVIGIPIDNCTNSTRLLRVRVIKACDLRRKDIFGTSDPYCQISLYKNSRSTTAVCPTVQTKTVKRNLNPVWNEEFVFRVNPDNRLVFQLFDHNRLTRDDFLGIVSISLIHVDIGTEGDGQDRVPRRFMLQPRSSRSQVKGNLVLYLIYLPTGTNVRTLSVSELPQASRRGATQPAGEGVSSPNTDNAVPGRASDSGRPSNATLVELATMTNRRTDGSSPRVETSTDGLRDVEVASGSQLEPTTASRVQAAGGRRHSAVADQDSCSSLTGAVVEEDSTSDVVLIESTPLPPGWDERVDQNGRTYYVDHVNKRSQWDRPSCPLPEGWQQRTDPNGRVYYVDHTHHRTTWNHPLAESTDVHPAHSPPLSSGSTADDGTGNLPPPASSPVAISGRALSSSPAGGRSASSSRPSAAAAATSSSSTIPRHADADQAAREMFMSRRQVSLEDTVDSSACAQASADGRVGTLRSHQRLRTNSTDTPSGVGRVAAVAVSTAHRTERARTSSEGAVERPKTVVPTISTGVMTFGGVVVVDDDPSETPLPDGWQMALHHDGRKFFINHNDQITTWVDPRVKQPESTTLLEDANRHEMRDLGPLPAGWEERVHSDGRLFYINHNERTTQWEDPRLAKLSSAALPYSRDYIQKRTYFYTHLRKPKDPQAKFEIQVRRQFVLEDSFRIISPSKKPEILMHRLWIEFIGEKGLDYGGLKREFFFLISKEVFNPYYGLFEYSAADKYTLQINPSSGVANEYHLSYFWFCGCIMAMAIYHHCLLDAYFVRPFYKMMLGRPIHLQDMEPVDDHMYRSLRYLLDEDLSADTSDFTFSVTEQRFGEIVEVDLIPDGRNVPVTNENKKKFVECYIKWRYTDRVKPQMDALSSGFTRLIDLSNLKVFDANELEMLMCGIEDINLADWRNNTLYKGEYHANHPVILGFWRTVYTFTREMQIRLLQFVTGTSRVPMQGFSQLFGSNGPQKFTIECWGDPSRFPRAHTCFNRLDLPPYPTTDMLKCKLIVAIEQSEGFDGVD